jgi:hypothetical protein
MEQDANHKHPAGGLVGSCHRIASTAAGVVAIGLLVAACGGGSNGPAVATVGTSTTAAKSAPGGSSGKGLLAFSRCMRSHGVSNFPDPGSNGLISISSANGVNLNSALFKSAQAACQSLMPGGKPSPAAQAKRMAQALKFSQCMRAHGVPKFPDPSGGTGRISISIKGGPGSGLDPNSPQFQAAQKACQSISGAPKGGPAAGSKSTSKGSGSGSGSGEIIGGG